MFWRGLVLGPPTCPSGRNGTSIAILLWAETGRASLAVRLWVAAAYRWIGLRSCYVLATGVGARPQVAGEPRCRHAQDRPLHLWNFL